MFGFCDRCGGVEQDRNGASMRLFARRRKDRLPRVRRRANLQGGRTQKPGRNAAVARVPNAVSRKQVSIARAGRTASASWPNGSRRGKSPSPTSPDPILRRMVDRIDKAMKGRRSLESALAELEAKYRTRPSAELARMMEQLKAEIAIRKRRPNPEPG